MAGNEPPSIVSVSPARSAMEQEPTAPVVLTFSEPLAPETIDAETVIVEANGRRVAGTLAYADQVVTFTPEHRLPLRGLVTIQVLGRVADLAGATMLDDFTSGFWVRDGAWGAAMALDNAQAYRAGRNLPIDAAGNVLATFIRAGDYPDQRAFSRFYHPGVGLSAFTEHTENTSPQSVTIAAGLNEHGLGSVMWRQSGQYGYGSWSRTYRDGQWTARPVARSFDGLCVGTGVSPTDDTHYFQGTRQRYWIRCAPQGTCTAGDATPGEDFEDIPSLAFDSTGNAVAAWRREGTDAQVSGGIVAARYSAEAGHWTQAQIIDHAFGAESPAGGEPKVVAGPDGTAFAAWVEAGAVDPEGASAFTPHVLLTSYYTPESGWGEAEPLSLDIGNIGYLTPGVAFDGMGFVVAWTAMDGVDAHVYTRRFNGDDWEAAERRDPEGSIVRKVMPQLLSDAAGDLVLTWLERTNVPDEQRLAYRRRNGGNWSSRHYLDELVLNPSVEDSPRDPPVQLGLGTNGVAAVMWEQRSATGLEKLWLAVFE